MSELTVTFIGLISCDQYTEVDQILLPAIRIEGFRTILGINAASLPFIECLRICPVEICHWLIAAPADDGLHGAGFTARYRATAPLRKLWEEVTSENNEFSEAYSVCNLRK